MGDASEDPKLNWQDDHVFLSCEGIWFAICSAASQEVVELPHQDVPGDWSLQFQDGLAVVFYTRDGKAEPCFVEYAQFFFEWAAYRSADGTVTMKDKSHRVIDSYQFLAANTTFRAGVRLPGAHEVVDTSVAVHTHAFPGRKCWWSLRSLSQHLGWCRPGKRKFSSAVVYDRWDTWDRLVASLNFPGSLRRGLRGKHEASTACPSGVDDAVCTSACLLTILCKDAYELRLSCHAHSHAAPSVAAATWLSGLLSMLVRPHEFEVFMDPHMTIDAAGRCKGTHPCTVFLDGAGQLHLQRLKAKAQLCWPGGGPPLSKCSQMRLASLADCMPAEEALRLLCGGPLSQHGGFLLAQILWHFGLRMEMVLLQDTESL